MKIILILCMGIFIATELKAQVAGSQVTRDTFMIISDSMKKKSPSMLASQILQNSLLDTNTVVLISFECAKEFAAEEDHKFYVSMIKELSLIQRRKCYLLILRKPIIEKQIFNSILGSKIIISYTTTRPYKLWHGKKFKKYFGSRRFRIN
jgi:hypothetical protein